MARDILNEPETLRATHETLARLTQRLQVTAQGWDTLRRAQEIVADLALKAGA